VRRMASVVVIALVSAACSATLGGSRKPTATPVRAATSQTSATVPPGMTLYANADPRFTVAYPSTWSYQRNLPAETTGGVLVVFRAPPERGTGGYQDNIVVWDQQWPYPITGRDVTARVFAIAREWIADYHFLGRGRATLSGLKGAQIEYTGTNEGHHLRLVTVWTGTGSTAYFITYAAEPGSYDHYLTAARALIDSFHLT
jgi:hypothetical protein